MSVRLDGLGLKADGEATLADDAIPAYLGGAIAAKDDDAAIVQARSDTIRW